MPRLRALHSWMPLGCQGQRGLQVLIAQAALLRNVRDNLADQLHTTDLLLFEAQEMKDLLNDE